MNPAQSQSQGQGQSRSQTQAPAESPPLRWLRVEHQTVYDYDVPVELAHHLACLSPRWRRRLSLRSCSHWRA